MIVDADFIRAVIGLAVIAVVMAFVALAATLNEDSTIDDRTCPRPPRLQRPCADECVRRHPAGHRPVPRPRRHGRRWVQQPASGRWGVLVRAAHVEQQSRLTDDELTYRPERDHTVISPAADADDADEGDDEYPNWARWSG